VIRRRKRRWVAAGFVGGLVAGMVIWSVQMRRSRRDLFSRSPIKRLAALGYLAGQPGVESVQLLSDYCRWETNPMLHKRASRLLNRMKARLV
jgi:hypothetical protein